MPARRHRGVGRIGAVGGQPKERPSPRPDLPKVADELK